MYPIKDGALKEAFVSPVTGAQELLKRLFADHVGKVTKTIVVERDEGAAVGENANGVGQRAEQLVQSDGTK
jgi:hypothetical protein